MADEFNVSRRRIRNRIDEEESNINIGRVIILIITIIGCVYLLFSLVYMIVSNKKKSN